jgi:hypothetical protein
VPRLQCDGVAGYGYGISGRCDTAAAHLAIEFGYISQIKLLCSEFWVKVELVQTFRQKAEPARCLVGFLRAVLTASLCASVGLGLSVVTCQPPGPIITCSGFLRCAAASAVHIDTLVGVLDVRASQLSVLQDC